MWVGAAECDSNIKCTPCSTKTNRKASASVFSGQQTLSWCAAATVPNWCGSIWALEGAVAQCARVSQHPRTPDQVHLRCSTLLHSWQASYHPTAPHWVQHAAFVEEKQTAHLFAQCQPAAISQWAAGRGVVHPHQPVCTAGHIGAFHDSSSSLPLMSSGVQGVCLSFLFSFPFFSTFSGVCPTGLAECNSDVPYEQIWALIHIKELLKRQVRNTKFHCRFWRDKEIEKIP